MPLALRDPFISGARVIEHLRTEISGDYKIEYYAVLCDYRTCSAYIFFYKDEEFVRNCTLVNFEDLISFHMKHVILNLYPLRSVNA